MRRTELRSQEALYIYDPMNMDSNKKRFELDFVWCAVARL